MFLDSKQNSQWNLLLEPTPIPIQIIKKIPVTHK